MRRPLLKMLDCTVRRELRQMTLWLICALYLAFVLAAVYPLTIYGGARTGFESLRMLNFLTAVLVPAYGASRIVDDVASGTVMLMRVAAVTARQWVAFRLLTIFTTYLTIWIIRIPVYAVTLFTGTATPADLLWGEALSWCVMLGCAQIALLVARYSETEQGAIGASIGLLFVLNAAYFLPLFVILLLGVTRVSIPPIVQLVGDLGRDLSPLTYLFQRPLTPERQVTAGIGLALQVVYGLMASYWLCRLLFIQSEPGALQVAGLPRRRAQPTSRPSRRVWDDAFAWQASELHCRPSWLVRILMWGIGGFLAFASMSLKVPNGSTLMGAVLVVALIAPGMIPTACISHELKQNTLSCLAVLPLRGGDIYRGWLRGARSLRMNAIAGAILALACLLWLNPVSGLGWAAIGLIVAYTLPPISFKETLSARERSWKSILRSALFGGSTMLFRPFGALPVLAIGAVASLLYRPRAVRLIDEEFDAISAT